MIKTDPTTKNHDFEINFPSRAHSYIALKLLPWFRAHFQASQILPSSTCSVKADKLYQDQN